jgi:starch phosphorylase
MQILVDVGARIQGFTRYAQGLSRRDKRNMQIASNLPRVAYFSMEIALHPDIPTYSGGLGVLAGDTLRSAADLGVPITAVTLVHRKGYFRQRLDASGQQTEQPQPWRPEQVLQSVPGKVSILIEGRRVAIRAWRFEVVAWRGASSPCTSLIRIFLRTASGIAD